MEYGAKYFRGSCTQPHIIYAGNAKQPHISYQQTTEATLRPGLQFVTCNVSYFMCNSMPFVKICS